MVLLLRFLVLLLLLLLQLLLHRSDAAAAVFAAFDFAANPYKNNIPFTFVAVAAAFAAALSAAFATAFAAAAAAAAAAQEVGGRGIAAAFNVKGSAVSSIQICCLLSKSSGLMTPVKFNHRFFRLLFYIFIYFIYFICFTQGQ